MTLGAAFTAPRSAAAKPTSGGGAGGAAGATRGFHGCHCSLLLLPSLLIEVNPILMTSSIGS